MLGRTHSPPLPPQFPRLALPDADLTTSARQTRQNAAMTYTHLDFEGVSVIGAWCKISMYSGSATERSRVGDVIIKSKAIAVTRTVWTACYSTWWKQSRGWQFSWKVRNILNQHLDRAKRGSCWSTGRQPFEGALNDGFLFFSDSQSLSISGLCPLSHSVLSRVNPAILSSTTNPNTLSLQSLWSDPVAKCFEHWTLAKEADDADLTSCAGQLILYL